jgi:hypothetical protein
MLPGHVSIGFLWPRCKEASDGGLIEKGDYPNAEELVEEISLCRHIDREQQDPEVSKVTPMPTTFEVLSAGTVLFSDVTFAGHATEVEKAVIGYGLNALEWVGAKSGSGFGKVRVEHEIGQQAYVEWLANTTDLLDRIIAVARDLK